MFVKYKRKFLFEVKSILGNSCAHFDKLGSSHVFHEERSVTFEQPSQTEVENILCRDELAIKNAYKLSRDLAKQVLVVMISDLDRVFKAELPHAVQIAYGLTGYTVTVEQVRNILTAVRKKCNEFGLDVVAECFDRAFARLATRDYNNTPLILLQPSKDIWNKASRSIDELENLHADRTTVCFEP